MEYVEDRTGDVEWLGWGLRYCRYIQVTASGATVLHDRGPGVGTGDE